MALPYIFQRAFDVVHIKLSLTTTSTTADQVLNGSYTPISANTLILLEGTIEVHYTAFSGTGALLGDLTLRWGTSVIKGSIKAVNPDGGSPFGFNITWSQGLPFEGDGSKSINGICTPASATSITWIIDITAIEVKD